MKRILPLLAALFLLLAALQTTQAQTFKIVLRFPNQPGGGAPSAVLDVNGNLYGTTQIGGPSKLGNVFEFSSQGKESTLYSFTNTTADGRTPTIGPLIQDAAGNFYGTTQNGGDYNCVVFYVRLWDRLQAEPQRAGDDPAQFYRRNRRSAALGRVSG